MNFKSVFLTLLVLVSLMTTIATAQRSEKLPPIKYEEFRLKNGLRVILHQDKSTPIVAVNVWYHVGSKNEVTGRTGFAHLFEHMMFQGSKNYDADYFTPLQEAGANINGSTTSDRTNYYEVVPSNFLELALYMEADRMGGLLEAMTIEKLNNQRDVVKNERRQRVDNQPYGQAGERIGEIMFPVGHPYNWSVIGSLDDLSAASLEDVKGFFRQYYVPNNASLVIAGDFDAKQAKMWTEKYFGSIAKGADITRPNPAMPKLEKETRVAVEDPLAPLPRVSMVWHSVRQGDKDEAALDMLGSILSSGRGSRLQSNLVYGKELVQTIGAGNGTREVAGTFQVTALARPGKALDEIEKEINSELERIKTAPPSNDEITRALNQIETGTIFGLQTVLDRADALNSNAIFYGKPDLFQKQLDEYRKVTPADIQRVANNYLTANRLVMTFVPQKGGGAMKGMAANAAANKPTSVGGDDKKKSTPDAAKLPKAGADPKFSLPPIEKTKLSNGLEVWTVRQTELPIVSMNLVLKSGGTFDSADKSGVSSLTATLLDDGTKTRSALEIANGLQSIGASVGAGSGWDSTNVSMSTLTKNLDRALDIYSDVIVNPVFPETELETVRKRALVGFIQRKSNPNAISDTVYNRVLYGKNHPYGRQLSGDEISVKGITRADLVKSYESTFRPNNAVLIVVGDVAAKTLTPKLEKAFANWKPGAIPTGKLPDAMPLEKAGIYLVDRPNSAQSVVSIGQVGVARDNPDYFPLQVLNSTLGGSFSRLDMNLREGKGYTYGARSNFIYRRGAGPFTASADVQTAVTKESVMEFIKEIKGIRGEIPITPQELESNKQRIIRGYPRGFETVGQISAQLSNLVVYGLTDSYFNEFISKINAVTIEDVNRVANKYLTPDKLAIVIVGDRKVIEPGLKQLEYPIMILDTEGNPVQ